MFSIHQRLLWLCAIKYIALPSSLMTQNPKSGFLLFEAENRHVCCAVLGESVIKTDALMKLSLYC